MMAEMLLKADERDNPRWGERLVEYYTEDGMWASGSGFADVGMAERGKAALTEKFTTGTRICDSSHLRGPDSIKAVPYTHLTLPTTGSVQSSSGPLQ